MVSFVSPVSGFTDLLSEFIPLVLSPNKKQSTLFQFLVAFTRKMAPVRGSSAAMRFQVGLLLMAILTSRKTTLRYFILLAELTSANVDCPPRVP